MATDICVRRLTKELRAFKKDPVNNPKISVCPIENNILELHYCIEGSEGTPYHGGFYHGKLIFPKEYPLKPPSVLMCTPSGRFQPNRRLCLSMSDFHPESWNPMWSVSTILTGLYSFMLDSNPTLGSIETSDRKKRQLAASSLAYNVKDGAFVKLFPEYVELYQERLEKEAATRPPTAAVVSVDRPDNTEMAMGATLAGILAILSIVMAFQFLL
jgi:ubiquitin-conjugating enzyme E2 J2